MDGVLGLGKRVGNAVRLAEVIQVLIKHGFVDLVYRAGLHEGLPARVLRTMRILESPAGAPETEGQRLCAALAELGPAFVKFGQVLSTRPDLVGPSLSHALSSLQDRVAATSFDQMLPVLEADLGASPLDRFAAFDQTPVAAASLSQVYRGMLPDGTPVAVKVQRPTAAPLIEADLGLMRWIAEWAAARMEESAWIDPVGLVDEFALSIRRELDFDIEAHILERFRRFFKDAPEFLVPAVYSELSSRRVLTMDWVDGVRVDDLKAYAARNSDPKKVAEAGCRILCRQVFEHRLFHGDPHPGNVFLTRDNQIAMIDYGMVGHIDRADAAALAELLWAILREDAEAGVETMLALTTSGTVQDRQALEHRVADFIAFESQAIVSGGNVADGIYKLVEILRAQHLQLAPRFSLLLKALATIESTAHALDPELDIVPILQPHVERLVARRYAPLRMMAEARRSTAAFLRLGRRLPGDLEPLLQKLRKGEFKLQVYHEHLERLSGVLDRASNRIAFGVITGSLIIGSSLLITTSGSAYRLGLGGFVVAGVLGLSLLISILRSRNY